MKKVFIGVFAALMLFAFVACDNQVEFPKEITGIAVVANGDSYTYLEGEAFDFRGIQIVATYKDGTVQPLEQSQLSVLVVDGSNKPVTRLHEDSVVSIAYQSYTVSSNGRDAVKVIPFAVEPITALTVTSTVDEGYAKLGGNSEAAPSTPFDKSALTVTAKYANGATREVADDEFTATYDSSAAGADKVVTVTVDGYDTPDTTSVKLTLEEDYIVDFGWSVPETKKVAYITDTKSLDLFEFTYKWASGAETVEGYAPTLSDIFSYDDEVVTETAFTVDDIKAGNFSAEIYLVKDETKSAKVSIPVKNSYLDGSVSVTPDGTLTAKPGSTITNAIFADIVTANDAAGNTAVKVPTSNIVFKVGNGEWVTSYLVPHFNTASVSVTVGVAMEGQTPVAASSSTAITVSEE